jgi:hypothetical protein
MMMFVLKPINMPQTAFRFSVTQHGDSLPTVTESYLIQNPLLPP